MKPEKRDKSKLPKWAQQEMERLESNVAYHKNEVEQMLGTAPENAYFSVYDSDNNERLIAGRRIAIRVGDKRFEILVRSENSRKLLTIYGDPVSRLKILPCAANSIEIE